MPDSDESFRLFSGYLAGRLVSPCSAVDFTHQTLIVINDLEVGINSATGESIGGELFSLVRKEDSFYGNLATSIPQIAKAVCPDDFAKGVNEAYEAVVADKR